MKHPKADKEVPGFKLVGTSRDGRALYFNPRAITWGGRLFRQKNTVRAWIIRWPTGVFGAKRTVKPRGPWKET